MKEHKYEIGLRWVGNTGEGTKTYRGYKRDHVIAAAGKPELPASSDPNFRGDPSRYNPEELLVASLSSCHMLWYLHLCAVNKVVVVGYEDDAHGVMEEKPDGSGEFVRAELKPRVTIASGDPEVAKLLHHEAHKMCFIANSVRFPVKTTAEIVVAVTSH